MPRWYFEVKDADYHTGQEPDVKLHGITFKCMYDAQDGSPPVQVGEHNIHFHDRRGRDRIPELSIGSTTVAFGPLTPGNWRT